MKRAIHQLRAQSIHPYFPAYLHLRRQAAIQGSDRDIDPAWHDLSPLLQVRDAPTTRPHLRPFTLGTGGAVDAEWLNPNLAGSFAPSSLRPGQPPLQVVDISTSKRGRFSLKPKHWLLARKHLLTEVKIPLWATGAFLLRDHGWQGYAERPGYLDLQGGFLDFFGYERPDMPEVDHLYDLNPAHDIDVWFEPLAAQEESS